MLLYEERARKIRETGKLYRSINAPQRDSLLKYNYWRRWLLITRSQNGFKTGLKGGWQSRKTNKHFFSFLKNLVH